MMYVSEVRAPLSQEASKGFSGNISSRSNPGSTTSSHLSSLWSRSQVEICAVNCGGKRPFKTTLCDLAFLKQNKVLKGLM
ncbi:hypothetical protein CEXT_619491 [Caerostris extrusa]|uniref:Uncharacterized protein n=1 Tax=Caerostris extrusa TaxID=172846 RepID=A0AAV4N475_CAEEX|nr:hypothetical protein CEXT_619491 [Caerostris extrusa]